MANEKSGFSIAKKISAIGNADKLLLVKSV